MKIKQEFAEESQEQESKSLDSLPDGHRPNGIAASKKDIDPDEKDSEDIPF